MDDGMLYVLFHVPDQPKLVPVIDSELFVDETCREWKNRDRWMMDVFFVFFIYMCIVDYPNLVTQYLQ